MMGHVCTHTHHPGENAMMIGRIYFTNDQIIFRQVSVTLNKDVKCAC